MDQALEQMQGRQQQGSQIAPFGGLGDAIRAMRERSERNPAQAQQNNQTIEDNATKTTATKPGDPLEAHCNEVHQAGEALLAAAQNYRQHCTEKGIPNVPPSKLSDEHKALLRTDPTLQDSQRQVKNAQQRFPAAADSFDSKLNHHLQQGHPIDTRQRAQVDRAHAAIDQVNQKANGEHANLPLKSDKGENIKGLSESMKKLSASLAKMLSRLKGLFSGASADAAAPGG